MMKTTALTLTLLLLSAACQPWAAGHRQQDGKPTVEAIYTGLHCGRSETSPQAKWVDDAQQLEVSVKRIQRNILGSKPMDFGKLDFQHEFVLAIKMGQQPTLGHRIELLGTDGLRIAQKQAHITLNWAHPPADALAAQMVSSPCLLLKLKRGDYTSVQIHDTQGTIRATADKESSKE